MKLLVRSAFAVALTGLLSALIFSTAQAVTSSGGVQGYASDRQLDNGLIVQLAGEEANRVVVATQENLQNMFGVTVDRNLLAVTLSNPSLENETFVAVSGTYNTRVSTQGGPIAVGDYLTMSSISGVAMKAGTEEEVVFGRANAAFDGRGANLGTVELEDVDGTIRQRVTLGSIPVTIDIKRNPNEPSTTVNVPEPLRRVGLAIAEKEVSPLRIYLSLGIMIVSVIAAIAMLYAGIRNAVISIGRNPMSKRSIFRALIEIILTSLLILIIGLFAVYLLLRL